VGERSIFLPYTQGEPVQKYLIILAVVAASLFGGDNAFAASPDSSDAPIQEGRNWSFTIPLWVPGYRGEFAVGDIDVDGESSGGWGPGRFFDNELSLNFFFMGGFAYERDRWRFYGDIFGGKFTDDVIFKLTDGTVASATVQPIIPNLHADYQVYKHPWGDSGHQQVRVSVYGGLRIYDVRVEVDVANVNQSLEDTWVDPIVGLWVPVDLSRRWYVEGSADIGGFNVGSRLSWRIYAAGAYRANDLLTIIAGYNVLGIDYRSTIASQDFVFKAAVGGPLLGIRFNF